MDNFTTKESIILRGKLTYDAEGNNISSSPYYSRVIHWSGNEASGVTLGRGYDMGDHTESDIFQDMLSVSIDEYYSKKNITSKVI